ncbi:MAG: tRNA (N6-isopentenyl adenosine(37)-C2)-methylthiotransferase MiaB [Opitutaceae bacterium]|nr:tRNA (N6-isopentenyl adenosine(37)-C2)-methylthiotransferase MiaB [Opitutaceae bacterium]
MNRVFIKTYGCQMNERDSEAVAAALAARGWRLAASEEECDVMLLNTCAVRDAAERKAVGKAERLLHRKRRQPGFVVGMMGCVAQGGGAALLERLPDLDLIVGTQKFHRVPDILEELRVAREAGLPAGGTVVETEEEPGAGAMSGHLDGGGQPRVSAFVSIQQGCDMRCSFCIVPSARGDERSRPAEEIVAECRALAARGVREVTLLGQIVTSYGRGRAREGGVSPFVRLLERVGEIGGIERIRFTSPHPCGFREDLVEAFARLPKLCECAHLPMQSGSDRILRAMNRPYSAARYKAVVDALRRARPGMYLSTDVIVGFPGETEADFEATRALFGACDFDMAYVFKYSPRGGTAAAGLPGRVPEAEMERRNQVLLGMLRENSLRRNAGLVGKVEEVLVEGPDRTGARLTGRTRGNRVVIFEGAPGLAGRLVNVRVERATASSLYGTVA